MAMEEIPGHNASYIQVAPYKYNIYDSTSLIIRNLYPELSFEKEGEKIKKVTSGNSVDLIPVNKFKPWIFVNIAVIILSTGILFFLIHPILLLIYRFKTKEKISKILLILNGLGLALLINNCLLIYQASKYLYYSSQRVLPFIYGNIIISIASLLAIILLILSRKKIEVDKFNKKNILIYSIILFIVLVTLYSWNFMKIF